MSDSSSSPGRYQQATARPAVRAPRRCWPRRVGQYVRRFEESFGRFERSTPVDVEQMFAGIRADAEGPAAAEGETMFRFLLIQDYGKERPKQHEFGIAMGAAAIDAASGGRGGPKA